MREAVEGAKLASSFSDSLSNSLPGKIRIEITQDKAWFFHRSPQYFKISLRNSLFQGIRSCFEQGHVQASGAGRVHLQISDHRYHHWSIKPIRYKCQPAISRLMTPHSTKRVGTWLCMLVMAAVLSGCAQIMWRDTTGHHRSGSRAEADYKTCASEAGIAALTPNVTYDETTAYRQRLLICMYSYGWRPADLQHL